MNDDDLKFWLEYIKEIAKIDKNIRSSFSPRFRNKQEEVVEELHYQRKRKKACAVDARIDLHGFTQDQAFEALTSFLEYCYHSYKQNILIITGKGNTDQPGVIKLVVPRWLEYTELKRYVLSYSTAKYEFGGEGAVAVVLKRKPKER